jgi:radical SAM protein with 4Fe4S-binding SPASM domain
VEAFAGKGRIRQLTLTTNAIATERVVELFSEILERFPGLRINFDLSIDAVGQAHDALRGVEGAYQAAVETYRRILALKKKHKNFRLGVTSVLSSFNLEDVIPLLEKLDEDFELDRREVMLARGDTREKAATEVPIEKFEDVHKWLLQKNRGLDHSITGRFLYQLSRRKREVQIETVRNNRMIIPCLAGRKLAVIDADGTVRPCEIIHTIHPEKDFTLGNLRENDYDFPRIMRSEKAAQVKNFIRNSRCYCTFECAILANLVFHPINLINIAARSLMPHPAKSRVEDLTNGQGSNRSNYS